MLCASLVSLFPAVGVAADAALPKDETPGASMTTETGGAVLNDYDKLYVGADGKTTANGGKLVAYYSAVREDVSTVDVSAKTWADKLGGAPATLYGDTWETYDSGFGYDFSYDGFIDVAGNYGLALPEVLLTENLTVETLGRVNSFREADGTIKAVTSSSIRFNKSYDNNASFVRIDLLASVFFVGMPREGNCEKYAARWFLSAHTFSWFYNGRGEYPAFSDDEVYYSTTLSKTPQYMSVILTAQYERITAADGTQKYTVTYPTSKSYAFTLTPDEKVALEAEKAGSEEKAKPLSFFNGIPSDVYVIRVYDAPLTQSEKNQNAAADVLAYAGVDLTKYLALPSNVRDVINGMLAKVGILESEEEAARQLNEMCALFETAVDVKDTLYVQEA